MRIFRLVVFCLFSLILESNGQPTGPGGTDPGGGGNPTPITGIEILIALGSLFGVKKIVDYRRKK